MANYTPEEEMRVKEIYDKIYEPFYEKSHDLRWITDILSLDYIYRITWLAKAVTAVVEPEDLYFNKVKTEKNMTNEETVKVSECASEIADVLIKYATKNFSVQEEKAMNEYTATYPVHLGQEVWVDMKAIQRGLLQTKKQYLRADICALIVQTKGNTERKSIKLRIGEHWKENGGNFCYKYFTFAVSAIGKTVFLDKPDDVS